MKRLLFACLLCLVLPCFGAESDETSSAPFTDARLAPLKDLDGYFPFTPSSSPEAWRTRAEQLRLQIRIALGIWPEPTRTPLNAAIFGRVVRDDYAVEKVAFESMPGFFVTGSLYRPKQRDGATAKRPAVIYAHGHWADGRFMVAGNAEVKTLIETGAEKFENAARNHLDAACVQLARMGCMVFQVDMLGYADSTQLPLQLVHKFARQRQEMNTEGNWGLFSPQAEAHAQSVMGLQIWNGIRSLDFLCSLPDVDPQRLGVTGASGGGTQTMLLAAIDPRITAAFPAVMVSTAMQGGCTCENASLLRVGTGNIEFAALFAPKPMAMTAANDWTKEMPSKGFPELQRHWAMLGAPDNVQLNAFLQFPHNYNAVSRSAMFRWFNQHLGLGLAEAQLDERDFQPLTREEKSVWDVAHPQPEGGSSFERKLLRWWHDDAQTQIMKSPADFRAIAGLAIDRIIGRSVADHDTTSFVQDRETSSLVGTLVSGWIRNETRHEQVAVTIFVPKRTAGAATASNTSLQNTDGAAGVQEAAPGRKPAAIRTIMGTGSNTPRNLILWIDPHGRSSLSTDGIASEPAPEVLTLAQDLDASIIGVDLFGSDGNEEAPQRQVSNPRESAAYTFGYNPALFVERTHDILTVLEFIEAASSDSAQPPRISLVASGFTAPVAAAARAISGKTVYAAVLESDGFRFGKLQDCWSRSFLPGAAKYGDLPGMLALAAPQETFVLGEVSPPELTVSAYHDAHADGALHFGSKTDRPAALDWLKERLRQPVTP